MHQGAVSEDCLYLNLWTPAHPAAARLPVLVFLHGGAFTQGSVSVPLYDGAALARRDLIVVTINYRLGAFGFLAHPALTQESDHHASGNYGLMDQLAALRWVRANIAAFGGDSNRVTIAGQSAGAICAYLLTGLAPGEGTVPARHHRKRAGRSDNIRDSQFDTTCRGAEGRREVRCGPRCRDGRATACTPGRSRSATTG
ncbi:MAG: carboxylesterase family protein [Steroidobacteraceae bacterium]